jgi:hypothetical protein
MKKIRIIGIFLCLQGLSSAVSAAYIDSLQAKDLALTFYQNRSLSENAVREIRHLKQMGSPEVWVVSFVPNGFVLLSATTDYFPILAYSTDGLVDEFLACEPADWWLSLLSHEQVYFQKQQSDRFGGFWDDLRMSPAIRTGHEPAPLISSLWGQFVNNSGHCGLGPDSLISYNRFCPANTQCMCGHCTAGCVAVAMAQIIRYWCYPAACCGHEYDYCNMPNEIFNRSEDYSSATSISRLIADCGALANMLYCSNGSCGSSSSISHAKAAFTGELGYLTSANIRYRSACSLQQWKVFIYNEIDAGRPIYYRGEDGSGGHAFICDGYDHALSDLFHFNMGWNGGGNAYYYMPGNGLEDIGYPYEMQMLTNLRPGAATEDICTSFVQIDPADRINDSSRFFTVSAFAITAGDPDEIILGTDDEVTYSAIDRIRLLDGFHALYGSVFRASIFNCVLCTEGEKANYRNDRPNDIINEAPLTPSPFSIWVYPNPATDRIFVGVPDDLQTNQFCIQNSNGVYMKVKRSGQFLDVSELPNGVYLLTIVSTNTVLQIEFLVIRGP